jgi:malate dehydrogenase
MISMSSVRKGKVSVVGAGFYGSTTALRLAEYDIFESVVLTDIVDGKPEGIALDINQSRPIEGFETTLIGQTTTADGDGSTRKSCAVSPRTSRSTRPTLS